MYANARQLLPSMHQFSLMGRQRFHWPSVSEVRRSPLFDLGINRLNTPRKCQMLPPVSRANCRWERDRVRTFHGYRCRKPLTTGSHHRNTASDTGVSAYCVSARCVLLGIPQTVADRNPSQHTARYRRRCSRTEPGTESRSDCTCPRNASRHGPRCADEAQL